MTKIADYILPSLILILLSYAFLKKQNVYDCFIVGSKKSLNLVFDIFPYVLSIFIMLEIFNISGLASHISTILSPVTSFLGIPPELNTLIFLKPFSGSGSMAALSDILSTYGADSYIGRSASVIASSSETVFYISAVYFSKTNIKKLSYILPLCLFLSFLSSVLACLFCKIV